MSPEPQSSADQRFDDPDTSDPTKAGADAGPEAADLAFACPKCGATVSAAPAAVARFLACPACGEHLVIPAADGSTDVPDERDAVRDEIAQTKESELDLLRMRNMVVLKRTAMRSRSYAIVGAAGCAVAAVKLMVMTAHEVWTGGWLVMPPGEAWAAAVSHWRLFVFPVLVGLAVWGAERCLRRAAYWGRESKAIALPEPASPPDFTTLSDGSQHARHLEQVQ